MPSWSIRKLKLSVRSDIQAVAKSALGDFQGSVVALDEEELLSEGKRVSATMKAASP